MPDIMSQIETFGMAMEGGRERERCQIDCQIESQIDCQNICQIE